MSSRRHGTRSKYVLDNCRCDDCRKAHRDYEREAANRRYHPDIYPPVLIDAGPVVYVLRVLKRRGVHYRAIAERSGVPKSTITDIVHHQRTLRRDTYDKLRPVLLSYFGDEA